MGGEENFIIGPTPYSPELNHVELVFQLLGARLYDHDPVPSVHEASHDDVHTTMDKTTNKDGEEDEIISI